MMTMRIIFVSYILHLFSMKYQTKMTPHQKKYNIVCCFLSFFHFFSFNMVSGYVGIDVLLLFLLLKRIDNHRVCLRTYSIKSFR